MPIGTPAANPGFIGGVINTNVTAKKTVRFATDAPLDANTYDNGAFGVGATITIDAFGVLADIDGVTPVVDDRILVKDEVSGLKNGFYLFKTQGTGSTSAVLERTTDADESVEIGLNMNSFISEGTVNADTLITLTNDGSITIGTTALVFDFVIPATTDDLPEGVTNLYYTNARADGRIAAAIGVSVQAFSADNAFTTDKLSAFAATTSLELKSVISDESGSGALVFANSPTFVTPALGTPASGVATNLTGTASGLTSGKATNIVGGLGGQIPYQSAVDTTALLANGTAGQVLQSNGTTLAPSWVTPAAVSGDGMYDGNGTIPTTTVATVTDTLNFETGKVGIGITPTARLHAHETTTAGANFVFKATAGATTPFAIRDDGLVTIVGKLSSGGTNIVTGTNAGAIGGGITVSNSHTFGAGIDHDISGLFAGAIGSTITISGRASVGNGELHDLAGDHMFAGGNNVTGTAAADFSSGIGDNINLTAKWTHCKGLDLEATAIGAQVIGTGRGAALQLINANQFSLMVGFRTDVPTFFVSDGDGTANSLGNIGLFNVTSFGASSKGVLGIGTADVVPGSSPADMFQMYSADHSGAGTAAPHFRTEAGDIIKLFKGAALTGIDATALSTGGAAVLSTADSDVIDNIRTRLNEVETRLQANTLLT